MAKAVVACPHCGSSQTVEFHGSGHGSRECRECHQRFRVYYSNNDLDRVTPR